MDNMILLSQNGVAELFTNIFGLELLTAVLTLVNTGVIVLLYRKFLHAKVCAILEKRNEAVAAELEEAAASRAKAVGDEKKYTELLANSREESNRIVNEAAQKARKREEEIITTAEESAAHIRSKAATEIERERKRAMDEIKNQVAEIVILAAGAVAEKEINEADNEKLIESFLVNADA